MRQKFVVCIHSMVVLLLILSVVSAQDDLPNPVRLEYFLASPQWSLDSQTFVFKTALDTPGVQTEVDSWYQVDTDTSAVTRSKSWHLLPALSSSDNIMYGISRTGEPQYTYISPNGQFLVYSHTSTD